LGSLAHFSSHPFPRRSLVCGGKTVTQTSPHKSGLVVSHSTCPPLSSSPHARYSLHFVLGTAVINNKQPAAPQRPLSMTTTVLGAVDMCSRKVCHRIPRTSMRLCVLLRSVKLTTIGNNTLTIRTFNISFLPAIMSTSTSMHGEFLRLHFLQAHRETEAHFHCLWNVQRHRNATNRTRSVSKRAAFYQSLKGDDVVHWYLIQ